MNAVLRRQYKPEDFHDLSDAEAEEMMDLSLTRPKYNRFRLARAHGDISTSLIHLARANAYFEIHAPQYAAQLAPLARALSALIPSYLEMGKRLPR